MRKVTPEDGRKLCCTLMLARRTTGTNLTGEAWRVAGLVLDWAESGRNAATLPDIMQRLRVSRKVVKLALERLRQAKIIDMTTRDKTLQFLINWTFIDEVTAALDLDIEAYWRDREDGLDPDEG